MSRYKQLKQNQLGELVLQDNYYISDLFKRENIMNIANIRMRINISLYYHLTPKKSRKTTDFFVQTKKLKIKRL